MLTLKKHESLREVIRLLERKLGMLDELQSSCCRMTFAQCHALVEIGRAKVISLNKLARLLELDKSTMSRTINNLATSGMAVRESDVQDRRVLAIRLTPKGNKAFRKIEEDMGKYFSAVLKSIPEKKHGQVIESLQILLKAWPDKNCCQVK
jgi:DNA-binding MarR family transcriptional regulator